MTTKTPLPRLARLNQLDKLKPLAKEAMAPQKSKKPQKALNLEMPKGVHPGESVKPVKQTGVPKVGNMKAPQAGKLTQPKGQSKETDTQLRGEGASINSGTYANPNDGLQHLLNPSSEIGGVSVRTGVPAIVKPKGFAKTTSTLL